MNRQDRLDCLKLDHHAVRDEKIHTVAVIYGQIFVANGDRDLSAYRQSPLFQFVQQARLVSAFQEARPQRAMDLYRRRND
jgi:hypothetical protein